MDPLFVQPDMLFAQQLDQLSRREFLHWVRRGLQGLLFLPFSQRAEGKEQIIPVTAVQTEARPYESEAAAKNYLPGEEGIPEAGRVLDNTLSVYKRPSFSAKLVNMYWRDLVFPINGVTIGDQYPAYNRVWYLINGEGYAHSGKLQPVATRSNKPVLNIPAAGTLGEVTVPYTDTRFDPNRADRQAYRLYYSTVHWIMEIVQDQKGTKWYRVIDDKLFFTFYVNAEHIRLIPAEELGPISPQVPVNDKRIEVRLTDQVAIAYEGSRPVFMTRIASGGTFSDGNFMTPTGRFITNRKRPSRHMASEDLAASSAYDLPGVPWVSYLTLSGISFHGTYWHNDFGKPRSHGCINLSPQAARWIYRWTTPAVPLMEHTWDQKEGTRVDIVK